MLESFDYQLLPFFLKGYAEAEPMRNVGKMLGVRGEQFYPVEQGEARRSGSP